jgi:Right handed beta helix region
VYGESSFAESAFGEGVGLAPPLIPEIGLETRQLVYAIELELISVGDIPLVVEPPPPPGGATRFTKQVSFEALSRANRISTASLDAFGQTAAVVVPADFWMSPTGNDANPGTEALPWRTFAHADTVVGPGDLVVLKPGTYVEDTIVLTTSGTAGNPITYQSQVRHAAIIQPVDNQAGLEVILGDADYIILDGLQVDGTVYPELLGGITMQGSHTETKNCWIHHIRCLGQTDGGSGYLCGNGPTAAYDQVDNKIYNCRVNDIGNLAVPSALVHGIYLSHVDAQCFNNLVYRVEGGGIHLWHRASSIHAHNNTMFDCRDSGMILGHGTEPQAPVSLQNSKFSNNIVIDCPNGIRSSGAQGTGNEARNNTCFRCGTAFSLAASWGVSGSATTDPGLVNYQISGSGDYHPTAAGAAVNSGVSTWSPAFDYDNIARPQGAGVDRGAYETTLGISRITSTFDARGAVSGLINFGAGNTTRYYSIPNTAALNLGAGAWAWGMWTRLPANAGTDYKYLLSCSTIGVTPQWNLAVAEASVADGAAFANHWHFRIGDNAGVDGALYTSSAAPGGDNIERLIVLQSTGTTLELRFCPINTLTAVLVVNEAVNVGALTAPNPWNFGRRTDGAAGNYYDGWAGGLFKANVALTGPQIEAIAGGSSPVTVLGANCVAFWPFGSADATVTDVVSGIVATRQGSGW